MDDGSGSTDGARGGVAEAARRGDERTTLTGMLQRQRDLVAWKLHDADDEVLRGVSTPSGVTAHGIVRHLTNVERSWIRESVAGEQDLAFDWSDEDPDGEWRVPEGTTLAELLADYAEESRRCDAVVAAAESLDVVAADGSASLRWVLLHLVEETARHLGHLDLLRERADGATGEEPAG